jgi:beta-N-acetylglucosaminidase
VLPADVPTATPAPTPSGPTLADKFDDHFKNSALAGTGQDFVNAGYKYGIDPTLLASISSVETDKGTSHAVNAYNNVGGMMDPKSPNQTGFLKYDSVQEGIDAMASNLRRNYINQGLTTIPQIASVYSPVKPGGGHVVNDPYDTNRTWPMSVAQVQKKFGGGLGLMN